MDRIAAIRALLEDCDQSHVLPDGAQLTDQMLHRLESIEWDSLPALINEHVRTRREGSPANLEPAPHVTVDPEGEGRGVEVLDPAQLQEQGEALLAAGRVAAFAVAGGQGTRLGWHGPKGTFPASPVTGKPLFRLFAEQILAAQKKWGHSIRWYIMTSEANDAATRGFFLDNRCFGLDRRQIMIFPQGMMPALDMRDGKVLLEAPGVPAMSPDGHGGSLKALQRSGALDQMEGRGVDVISYFQVDNPLVQIFDPIFLGLHVDAGHSSGEFTSKMASKLRSDEKVGVFALRDGKPGVVEYSDLSSEELEAVDTSGRLLFRAGNLATHAIGTSFVRRVAGEAPLPWHRADKKVACISPETGQLIHPEEPNAVKLERFVFDAMALAKKPAILEVDRNVHFAPIKNAEGEDSPASSNQLQSDLYGSWLEQAGVKIPRRSDGHVDAVIEISPTTAMTPQDLDSGQLPDAVEPGASLAL